MSIRPMVPAVVLLALGLAACGGSPSVPAAGALGVGGTPSPSHVASLQAGPTKSATLNVESGVTALTIRAGGASGQLASAVTPAGSGQTPVMTLGVGGVVTFGLASTAAGGAPSTVAVLLDPSVLWTINLDGGATTETIDMRRGRVALISLTAGVTRAMIDLPARPGTQLVREVGGASELTVTAPASVAGRIQVGGGASAVKLGASTHSGVAAGSVFSTAGYAEAKQRLDLYLVGGVSSVSVTPQT